MKTCPTCNRTFEDSFTFCLIDGSVLSAPFDLKATLNIPEPRQTEPPPTEVLRPQEETKQEIPPAVASPQPEQKREELASTIAAPAPAFESPKVKASPAQSARNSKQTIIAEPVNQKSVKYFVIVGTLFAFLTVYTQSILPLIPALLVFGFAVLLHLKPMRKSNTLAWVIIVLGSIFIIVFIFWVITNKSRDTQTSPKKIDVNVTTPQK